MSGFLKQKYTRSQLYDDVAIYMRAKAVALAPEVGEGRALAILGMNEAGARRTAAPHQPSHESPSSLDGWPHSWEINPDRFPLSWTASTFYDFVTEGVWAGTTDLGDAATDAADFIASIEGRVSEHADQAPSGALEAILRSGLLRWRIEDQGSDIELSIKDVAHLAGVAEKTVRLNTDRKLEDRLPVHKQPNQRDVFVVASDAIAWIDRKFGYAPTRIESTHPLESLFSIEDSLKLLGSDRGAREAFEKAMKKIAKDVIDGRTGVQDLIKNPLIASALERLET